MSNNAHHEVWLVRHGETEWSKSGQHTSSTDLALTPEGERRAAALALFLKAHTFEAVFSSPMKRATDTAKLAGYEPAILEDLREWNYGNFEGLTTPQVQLQIPGWNIWKGPTPGGETPREVASRADRVIALAEATAGDPVIFSHGHILRVLGARWLGLEPEAGKYFELTTASISVLGYEREQRVLKIWNRPSYCP